MEISTTNIGDVMKDWCGQNQNSLSNRSSPVSPGIYYPKIRLKREKVHRNTKKRIVRKNGEFNIANDSLNKFSYLSSSFITMVEARWRWTLLYFFMAFTGDWLLFGFIHWVIALSHDDLIENHLPHNQNISSWTPCVKNIYGFTSAFLFSVEVHTTVAYGRRKITLECPQTIIVMCVQCIVSSILQAFLVGILFAKLTRPKSRTQTILFSKQVAISLRNDKLCLVFRVGDIRKSRILNIKVSVFILRLALNDEIENDFEQIDLKVHIDGCESSFFLWPISVLHEIDENSPLYDVSAADLLCGNVEMLAVFEGVIESTGQPLQARTSYTAHDILWGNRFVPIVTDDTSKPFYEVDFSKLSETTQVDTPLCSAREYASVTTILTSCEEESDY